MTELVKKIQNVAPRIEWKESIELVTLVLVFCFCLLAVSPTYM